MKAACDFVISVIFESDYRVRSTEYRVRSTEFREFCKKSRFKHSVLCTLHLVLSNSHLALCTPQPTLLLAFRSHQFIQNSIDELRRLLAAEALGQLDRFVDGNFFRRVGVQEFISPQP
jgi:hypothetical protein